MTAQALAHDYAPDFESINQWAAITEFDAQQVDCLIGIMLKILDGKCNMDAPTQQAVAAVYRQAHHKRSHLFDPAIHAFIDQVCATPDLLSLRHIHELRLFAESSIPKSVMKGFKQWLWCNMPV